MRFFKELPVQIGKNLDWRELWPVCGIILILFAGCATPAHQPAASRSGAEYVCNFAQFVQWPRDVFVDPKTPFVIGIYGMDTLDGKLQSLAKHLRINGRKVVVRPVQTEDEMTHCQILFISGVKRAGWLGAKARFSEAELAGIATNLSTVPVLTVAEDVRHFSQSGLMVNLSQGVDKTHFEINVAAANQAELKVSAKLQSLAWGIVR